MANNYLQRGGTIDIDAGEAAIASGALVALGDMVVIALGHIEPHHAGVGLTEGVFLVPKLESEVIELGKKLHMKNGVVQLSASGAVYAGKAWASAGAGTTLVAVKINA
ncbi:DUF2190 family protein [Edwardsiella tarda]|uniref:DUF2190 family protein n=1 Tax=Edwardsiella tarda TaxID=636 RepID=UPI0039BE1E27